MNIQNATSADIPCMVKMAKLLHAQSRFREFNFDQEKLSKLIAGLIEQEYGIAIVSEEDGIILGGIIGLVAEHYFGNDKISTDMGLFVQPESRNADIAKGLIKEYIKQAKQKGAIDICIGNTTGRGVELTGLLYKSAGFSKAGEVWNLEDKK